jgi:hypothetical protein
MRPASLSNPILSIQRHAVWLTLLLGIGATRVRAQNGGGAAFLVGYGALSIGALTSLATRNSQPGIDADTRVRFRLRGAEDWSEPVRVFRVNPDSVFVEGESTPRRSFARSAVDSLRVKVSTGRWAEGWGIGLVAGGAVGAALGYAAASSEGSGDDWFTPGEGAVIGAVVLGVSGSVLGAGIGLLAPSRWVTIGNPAQKSRVSIAPSIGRPGFVASVRF